MNHEISGNTLLSLKAESKGLKKIISELPTNRNVKRGVFEYQLKNEIMKDKYVDKKYEKEFDKLENAYSAINIKGVNSWNAFNKNKKDVYFKKDVINCQQIQEMQKTNETLKISRTKNPKMQTEIKNESFRDNVLDLSHSNFFKPNETNFHKSKSLMNLLNKSESYKIKNLEKFERVQYESPYSDLLEKKKKFYNGLHKTYYLNRTFFGDSKVPVILPAPLTYNLEYKTISEKARNEKNIKILNKLRYYINCNLVLSKKMIKEFFINNNIYDKEYYTNEKLDNFKNFLLDEKNVIDCRKNMIDIIKEGVEYTPNNNEESENAISSLGDEFKYNMGFNRKKLFTKSKSTCDMINKSNNIADNTPINNAKRAKAGLNEVDSVLVYDMNEQRKAMNKLKENNRIDINYMDNKQLKKLEKEFTDLFNVKINKKDPYEAIIQRLYYEQKQIKHDKDLERVAKRSHKLLEFVILQKAVNNKTFKEELLKDYNNEIKEEVYSNNSSN